MSVNEENVRGNKDGKFAKTSEISALESFCSASHENASVADGTNVGTIKEVQRELNLHSGDECYSARDAVLQRRGRYKHDLSEPFGHKSADFRNETQNAAAAKLHRNRSFVCSRLFPPIGRLTTLRAARRRNLFNYPWQLLYLFRSTGDNYDVWLNKQQPALQSNTVAAFITLQCRLHFFFFFTPHHPPHLLLSCIMHEAF